jgi:DNA polymerase/3'-5' exonuclease PolX
MDNDVRRIYGIGLKKANDLKTQYNIRTIDALHKYVRKIPDIVTDAQKLGLKYHAHINRRITRSSANKHVKVIKSILPNAIIAGSVRREETKIGDIDVLIHTNLKNAVFKLMEKKYIVAVLAQGVEKFSGVARLPGTNSYRRIDIIKTTPEQKAFALLYFTGDFVQNISMRQKAKVQRYSLSQNGLINLKTGKEVKGLKTEKDIFKYLNIPYKPPNARSHKGKENKELTKLIKKKGIRKPRSIKRKK